MESKADGYPKGFFVVWTTDFRVGGRVAGGLPKIYEKPDDDASTFLEIQDHSYYFYLISKKTKSKFKMYIVTNPRPEK